MSSALAPVPPPTAPKNADALMRTAAMHISNAVLVTKKAMEDAKLQSPALAQAERLSTALATERASVLNGQRDPADWVDGAKQSIDILKTVTLTLQQRNAVPASVPAQVQASLDVAKAAASEVQAAYHEGPPGWLFPMGALVVAGLGFWAYRSMDGAQLKDGEGEDEDEFKPINFSADPDEEDEDEGIEVIAPKRKKKVA